MKILIILPIIILITGCASLNYPPPKEEIATIKSKLGHMDQEVNPKSKQSLWATLFLNGKYFEKRSDHKQACTMFTTLSKMNQFPLQPLSKIKWAKNCQLSDEEIDTFLEKGYVETPPWSRELFVSDALTIAKRRKDKKQMAKYYALSAKYKRLQEEKIPLIQKAINIAPQEDRDKYLQQLYKVAPHTYPKPNNENVYSIARDFENNRRYRKARVLYRKIIKSEDFSFKERVDALERIRLSYKLQRDTKNYIKHTRIMDNFIRRYRHRDFTNENYHKQWIESQATLARLYWTEDHTKKALKIIHDLLKKGIPFPNLEVYVYSILTGIAMENKDTSLALEYLSKARTIKNEDKEMQDKINWYYGWNLFLKKDYIHAAEAFEKASKISESYYFRLKCSFWEAKSYIQAGDISSGHDLLGEIAELDSFGYYGIMAHRELDKPFSSISHQYDLPSLTSPQIPIYEWLLAMDEKNLAESYLRRYSIKFKEKEDIESSLPLYLGTEDYFWAIHRFYRIEASEREDVLTRKAYLIFPRPYLNQMQKVARRFKLTPEYLFSIARQESAFDPEARSPAEAYGLMQLIPKRARELSKKYNIRYSSPSDLYRPKTNIFMGGALLKSLKDELGGKFILSTASYNAKMSAVRRWHKKRFNGDWAMFNEMIPYSETQGYVKLVLRNYITYKRLAEKERFKFPEGIFTGLY